MHALTIPGTLPFYLLIGALTALILVAVVALALLSRHRHRHALSAKAEHTKPHIKGMNPMHAAHASTSALRAGQSTKRLLPHTLIPSSDLQLLPGSRLSMAGDATVAMHGLAADGLAQQLDAKAVPASHVAASTGAVPTAHSGRLMARARAMGQQAGTAAVAREAARAANRHLTMARAAHVRSMLTQYGDGIELVGRGRRASFKRAQRRLFPTHTVRRQGSGAVAAGSPAHERSAAGSRGSSSVQRPVHGVADGQGLASGQQRPRTRRRRRDSHALD